MYDLKKLQETADKGNIVLDGVPEDVYHAFPAMSSTGLKEFKKGPGYWRHWRENQKKDTQARLEGRLVHMAINEADRFKSHVAVIDGNRNSNDVKAQIQLALSQGKTVCKTPDYEMAIATAEYCRKHPLVSPILKSGKGEQTMLWKDPATGVQCKARVDWLTPSGVMVDWKTFDHVFDDDKLEKQIRDMEYQFQSAFYLRGYQNVFGKTARAFYHGFIRIDQPLDLAVREIAKQSVEEADPYIGFILDRFAGCQIENSWPMTEPEVKEIVVKPFWR